MATSPTLRHPSRRTAAIGPGRPPRAPAPAPPPGPAPSQRTNRGTSPRVVSGWARLVSIAATVSGPKTWHMSSTTVPAGRRRRQPHLVVRHPHRGDERGQPAHVQPHRVALGIDGGDVHAQPDRPRARPGPPARRRSARSRVPRDRTMPGSDRPASGLRLAKTMAGAVLAASRAAGREAVVHRIELEGQAAGGLDARRRPGSPGCRRTGVRVKRTVSRTSWARSRVTVSAGATAQISAPPSTITRAPGAASRRATTTASARKGMPARMAVSPGSGSSRTSSTARSGRGGRTRVTVACWGSVAPPKHTGASTGSTVQASSAASTRVSTPAGNRPRVGMARTVQTADSPGSRRRVARGSTLQGASGVRGRRHVHGEVAGVGQGDGGVGGRAAGRRAPRPGRRRRRRTCSPRRRRAPSPDPPAPRPGRTRRRAR